MDQSPADHAAALIAQLSLDEKLGLVHARFGLPTPDGAPKPEGAVGSAAYTPGVARLGIPAIQETDASLGVTNPQGVRPGDRATALPSSVLLAATFDPALALETGAAIGAEARAKGFAILLAGGANLVREPRGGRTFEYLSEDPLLTGVLAGASVAGIQEAGVVSTVKHFALNAQETGRVVMSAEIGEAALRESDLLAFQMAIELGRPGAVMTAYNKLGGTYCGESPFLLNDVLKGDWHYPGFVMSDWGGTHSTVEAALAGLDRQSGEELDDEVFFGAPLRAAVEDGRVPLARLDDMVGRILRALGGAGVLDGTMGVVAPAPDLDVHAALAGEVAEQGIVLLRNDGVLPLAPSVARVAVIGGHADRGVLSGGGSSQVTPPGSLVEPALPGADAWISRTYHPSSLVEALRDALPGAEIAFDDGADPAAAARAAAGAGVAIVVAEQWTREGADVPDLALPDGQDALVDAVAAANPRTVVVLVTGGPVTMPWLDRVAAVLAAWYPGGRGGEALAALLTGTVSPSGRLPITFPRGEDQLPRPDMRDPATTTSSPGSPRRGAFSEDYDVEGSDVGYRWFAREGHEPLFAFGHGLTYTTFSYDGLTAAIEGRRLVLTVQIRNTGGRGGIETPQLYAAPASGAWPPRLVGLGRVALGPGESARTRAVVDPRLLARFDTRDGAWRVDAGTYVVLAGPDARTHPLRAEVELPAQRLAP